MHQVLRVFDDTCTYAAEVTVSALFAQKDLMSQTDAASRLPVASAHM
jgi:hypothetical protein